MKKLLTMLFLACGTIAYCGPGITVEIEPNFPEPTHPDPKDPNDMV